MTRSLTGMIVEMPEPATLLLLGVGLLAVAVFTHWRMRGR
jgi:hypothetical protein